MPKTGQFVPYETLPPGTEAIYTGEKSVTASDTTDAEGNIFEEWELRWLGSEEEQNIIKRMQTQFGRLDDDTRRIRAHISSFVACDSGVPATIDEILDAIGRESLREPAFRNGCERPGICVGIKTSQPRQVECLQVVHEVIISRLSGQPEARLLEQYPYAAGFVRRTYEWLPPEAEMSTVQKLLTERMLLPFEFFSKASHAVPAFEQACLREISETVIKICYEEGGRGRQIDAEIEKLKGLPKISMAYPQHARKAKIDDPQKLDLYTLCCCLAHGLHTLCDCHHSTFRWIENWIYAIGTGRWGIPSRKLGAESERLARLLYGYVLGIDKWLLGIPMQFLLIDLAHVDLGFDPKNEIVRVYAHLGEEQTPVKNWLAAYLWTNLMYGTGGLLWGSRHCEFVEQTNGKGVTVREWMDSRLELDTIGREQADAGDG